MWTVTGRQPRLGHAVSLLGTVLFGASIALVAQIFQVSGPWYGAFGAWALGAAVAGLVLLAAALREQRTAASLRLTAGVAVAFAPLFALVAETQPYAIVVGLLANVAVLLVASARIAHGLAARSRAAFWEGLAVARGDPAWSFVSLTRERPPPESGQVSIRARFRSNWQGGGWGALEGASRFYVTEGRGAAVDAARRGQQPALVDLRIGPDGTPSIVALRVVGMVLRDE